MHLPGAVSLVNAVEADLLAVVAPPRMEVTSDQTTGIFLSHHVVIGNCYELFGSHVIQIEKLAV